MAREGIPFLAATALISGAFWGLFALFGGAGLKWISLCSLTIPVFIAYFFRDPQRSPPQGEGLIVSAADGKVVEIKSLPEGYRISVFLSAFDVHINRIPFSGKVTSVEHRPGRFLVASNNRASFENEQTVVGIERGDTKLLVKQIAGLLARRIVCNLKENDDVEKGDRFGLIKFGSRVDLIVPENTNIQVKVKDRVKGGETVIATLV